VKWEGNSGLNICNQFLNTVEQVSFHMDILLKSEFDNIVRIFHDLYRAAVVDHQRTKIYSFVRILSIPI